MKRVKYVRSNDFHVWYHVGVTLLFVRHHTHSGRETWQGLDEGLSAGRSSSNSSLSLESDDQRSVGHYEKGKKKQMPVLCRHAELGFNLVKLLGPRLRPFSTHVTTISSQALRRGKKGGRNPLLSLSKSDEDASSSCMATPASLANRYDAFDPILSEEVAGRQSRGGYECSCAFTTS